MAYQVGYASREGPVAAPLRVTQPGSPTRTVTSTVPFDYQHALAVDPTLQGALEQIRLSRLRQGAELVGGEQQLFGRLGEAPDLSAPQYANLPPAIRDALARAITPELQGIIGQGNLAGTSALARLQHGYGQTQAGIGAAYAARGGRSGGYGVHANEALHQYTLDQYDARQKAADALGTLQQSYLSGQETLAGKASTALTDAQERIGQQINAGLLGPTTQTRTVANPYLNPAAPTNVSTRVAAGGGTSYEPKPVNVPTPPAPKPAAPYRASSAAQAGPRVY